MTTEVGILNRLGVALAADSAVTLGVGKIYTSADKLFQLSDVAPVGIMIYGNAAFVGLPWETIIKSYRAQLGGKILNSLEEYTHHFIRFLQRNNRLFPPQAQLSDIERLFTGFYLEVREQIRLTLRRKLAAKSELEESDVRLTCTEVIKAELKELRLAGIHVGIPANFRQRARTKFGGMIRNLRKEVFRDLPMTAETQRSLTTLAVELLVRHKFGPMQTGVVIAGFGSREVYHLWWSFPWRGWLRADHDM